VAIGEASAAGAGSEPSTPRAPTVGSAAQQHLAASEQLPLDAVLDGDLLQQYLQLPPAQQRALVAEGCGGDSTAARNLALQLNNLVAQLLL
jgi:hypothetical protein